MSHTHLQTSLYEGWASRTQEERDEMNKKERDQRIASLSRQYGKRRVSKAQKEIDDDAKSSGRNTKKKPITWKEIQSRIENSKDRLKKGEVKVWDKEQGRWRSNKEDV